MTLPKAAFNYDLKEALADNRVVGLWRMMKGFRLIYLVAIIALAFIALARVGNYLLMRFFIDDVLGRETVAAGDVAPVAFAFIALALVQGGAFFVSSTLAARTAEGVVLRLRNYLFDHIQRLSFAFHDQAQTGDMIQRCTSDVDSIRRFFAEQVLGVGRIVTLFLFNFLALLAVNVDLALLSVLVIPVIVVLSVFFFKRVGKAYEAFQEQEAKLSTTLQENLTGVRVVKAFACQQYEIDKFEGDNWEKYARGRRFVRMHAMYWPVSDVLCGVQMLFGYSVAAVLAIQGTITVGMYLAYAGMLLSIIWPMRNLGRIVVQMSTGLVSYGRVAKLIREERENLDAGGYLPDHDVRGEVVFDNVCFAYEAGDVVLEDISLRAAPGEVVALMGATGSGKTSLVNLLPRFYEYDSGSLTLDGVELKDYPARFLRQQIGIVEQEPFLFSRTIRENIAYGVSRPVTDAEVEEAARAAAIHDVIMTFPEGYSTIVGEKGVTLSGGQKQRVAIARTLLKDPRILILDDATSSVDTETEYAIRGALVHLMEGRTSFVIAHRVQSVMNADQVLVLDRGRIVQRGTHEELMAQPGVYREIFDLQLRIEEELEEEMAGVGHQL
ncbi:MAG: ABC transporter ATP-binding protein/permease [Anaerolineae bacterium]|nr:ABC transporter ATP-binding protein/permease [Anaerolineae bacterium]